MSQTGSGSTTSYLWDEQGYGNIALEVNGANITNYLLGEGNLLSQNRAGTLSDYLPDGNGNIRALTGSSGSLSDQYGYDAYGNTTHSSGTTTNPYQYKGQQYDPATALYNLRARYYTPSSGRFLSRDTANFNQQNPVELNRYDYVADNPISNADPTGHELVDYDFSLSNVSERSEVGGSVEGQVIRNEGAGLDYLIAGALLYAEATELMATLYGGLGHLKNCSGADWDGLPPVTLAYGMVDYNIEDWLTGDYILHPVVAVKGQCEEFKIAVALLLNTEAGEEIFEGGPGNGNKGDTHAERVLYNHFLPFIPQPWNDGRGPFWAIGVIHHYGLCRTYCQPFFIPPYTLMHPIFNVMLVAYPYIQHE